MASGYGVVAAICLVLFFGLTAAVLAGLTEHWDIQLMQVIAADRRPWLTPVMKLLSVAGSGFAEFPFAIVLIISLSTGGRKAEARWYAGALLSGWALYALAKLAVRRHRPHVITHLMHGAGWYSYPSGHTMLAPLVFGLGVIAWSLSCRSTGARIAALGLAVLLGIAIGISRVYLGVHYPTDAIGGLLLGTAWAALSLRWKEQREARANDPQPVPRLG